MSFSTDLARTVAIVSTETIPLTDKAYDRTLAYLGYAWGCGIGEGVHAPDNALALLAEAIEYAHDCGLGTFGCNCDACRCGDGH